MEVSLVESSTGNVIVGPTKLSAAIDYDYDFDDIRDDSIEFSMGQLNFVENARMAAKPSLNRVIAQRIVDYVVNYWR